MILENNRYAFMASGNGSNAQKLAMHAKQNGYASKIQCLITDNPTAGVIEKMHTLEIPVHIVERKSDKQSFENEILAILRSYQVNWVLLAGFLKVLSSEFLRHFENREFNCNQVINIHPSLLPAYPGLKSYQRAFSDQVKYSGVTVHFVDDGVDTGPIIAQRSFPRFSEDTLEDFMARGLELEHQVYPLVFDMIEKQKVFL